MLLCARSLRQILLVSTLVTVSCSRLEKQFLGTWATADGTNELLLQPDRTYRSITYYELRPSGAVQLRLDTSVGRWQVERQADGQVQLCMTTAERINCLPVGVRSVDTVRQLELGEQWYRPGPSPAVTILTAAPDSTVPATRILRHVLRDLVFRMEVYFADHSTYPRTLRMAGVNPGSLPPSVVLRINAAEFGGWSATATFTGTELLCEIGAGTRAPAYGDEGEPLCRSPIHDRLAALAR